MVVSNIECEDIIVAQTSKYRIDRHGISLNISDFITDSLPHPSNIRPNTLFTADTAIVRRKAGILKREKVDEILTSLQRLFE